jgi:hypothetical protein
MGLLAAGCADGQYQFVDVRKSLGVKSSSASQEVDRFKGQLA